MKSRQRIKVATISPTLLNEKQLRQKRSCRDRKKGASRKDFILRHHSEVATRKEDIVGCNREMMLRPESNVEWTCNVSARQLQVATKI